MTDERAPVGRGLTEEQCSRLCDCAANDGMTAFDFECRHEYVRSIETAVLCRRAPTPSPLAAGAVDVEALANEAADRWRHAFGNEPRLVDVIASAIRQAIEATEAQHARTLGELKSLIAELEDR